jgi:hypothetical protein
MRAARERSHFPRVLCAMPTKTKSLGRDRQRISSQPHEISYAAKKLGRGGSTKVRNVKKQLGRKTGRKAVMSRVRKMVGRDKD